jgi:hypothetical protein
MYTPNGRPCMLPPQAAPIDRTPTGKAAFRNQAGIGASALNWDWEDYRDIIGDLGTKIF